jgi:hypothetical protein
MQLIIFLLLTIFLLFLSNKKESMVDIIGRGPTGKTGKPGKKGIAGDQGPDGPPGVDAHSSDPGFKGPIGDIGKTGSMGNKGYTGERGYKGPRGIKGDQGESIYNDTWKNELISPILSDIYKQIKKRNKDPPEKNPPITLNLHTPDNGTGEITAKYRVTEGFQQILQPYNYSLYII